MAVASPKSNLREVWSLHAISTPQLPIGGYIAVG